MIKYDGIKSLQYNKFELTIWVSVWTGSFMVAQEGSSYRTRYAEPQPAEGRFLPPQISNRMLPLFYSRLPSEGQTLPLYLPPQLPRQDDCLCPLTNASLVTDNSNMEIGNSSGPAIQTFKNFIHCNIFANSNNLQCWQYIPETQILDYAAFLCGNTELNNLWVLKLQNWKSAFLFACLINWWRKVS